METLACALRTIAGKYNACAKHEDCLAAAMETKCSGAGFCPPYFVNRQFKVAFEAEAQREVDRYCERATCSASGFCSVIGTMEPYCAGGHCTWIRTLSP
jgi:hypothetical protein